MIRGLLLLCLTATVVGQAIHAGTKGTAQVLTAGQSNTVNYAADGESIVIGQTQAIAASEITLTSPTTGANAPGAPTGYTIAATDRYFIQYTGAGTGNFLLTSFVTREIADPAATSTRVLLQWHAGINNWVQIAELAAAGAAKITTANVIMYRSATTTTQATAVLAVAVVPNASTATFYTVCTGIAAAGTCNVGDKLVITFSAAATNVAVSYGRGAVQGDSKLVGKFLGCWVAVAVPASYTGTYDIAGTVALTAFTTAPATTPPADGAWADGGFARINTVYTGSATAAHYFYREGTTTSATNVNAVTITTTGRSGSNRYALVADYAFLTASLATALNLNIAIGANAAFVANTLNVAAWAKAAETGADVGLEANFAAATTVTLTTPATAVPAAAAFTASTPALIFNLAFDPTANRPGTAAPQQSVVRLIPGNQNNVVAANANIVVAYCAGACAAGSTQLIPATRTQAGTILFRADEPGRYQVGLHAVASNTINIVTANNVATFNVLPRVAVNLVENSATNTPSGFRLVSFICNDVTNNQVSVTSDVKTEADFANNAAPSGLIKVNGGYRQLTTSCTSFSTKIEGQYAASLSGVDLATITWAKATSATAALTAVASTRDATARTVVTTNAQTSFSSWSFAGTASAGGTTPPSTTAPSSGGPTIPVAPSVPAVPTSSAVKVLPAVALLLAAIFALVF